MSKNNPFYNDFGTNCIDLNCRPKVAEEKCTTPCTFTYPNESNSINFQRKYGYHQEKSQLPCFSVCLTVIVILLIILGLLG